MYRYMLDTDTCSHIMKRSHPAVLDKLRSIPPAEACISVVTKAELLYGVEISPRRTQDVTALKAFLRHVEVLDFREEAPATTPESEPI